MIWILISLLAGAVLTIQVALNGLLQRQVGSPVLATLISFVAGLVVVAVAWVLTRGQMGPEPALTSLRPGWRWLGGVLGAVYVLSTIVALPRLGAGALVPLVVAGQLAMALVMDHYGWLGLEVRPVTAAKMIGAAMLLGGVYLIARR